MGRGLATGAVQRRGGRPDPRVDARVSQLIAHHERSLMRVALHWSICRDDAQDAYQRALEIYVRRIDSLDPATELSWMRVVVKHEALAVRRQRGQALPVEEVDVDACAPEAQRPVDDLLAGRERVQRSVEALSRLKPDEAKALMLKAQGLSYQEIGDALSWTYTKVNRCITEGRARFLKVYAEIEAGEECERFAPTLAALIAGTASADALLELRPHIRNCAGCRATVRELHATRLGRLAALWPLPALVAPLRWVAARFGDRAGAPDRSGLDLSPNADVGDLYNVIAPVDVQVPVQARPRLVEWAAQRAGDGIASVKQHATSAYTRAVDPTPLAGARPGAAVAAVAGCLAVGGGTTYCVTQGVDPISDLANVVSPARVEKAPEPHKKRRAPRRASVVPITTPAPAPVVTPTADSRPAEPTARSAPKPTPEPTPPPAPEEEYEPVAAAASDTTTGGPATPSRTPAPAPAGGPGEFEP